MKKSFILIFIIWVSVSEAQAPKKFYTRFGGYGYDIGYGVLQTLNGQYAVTGSTSSFGNGNTDLYLALVDSMGWVRWEKSYGGFNNDIGKSIIQLPDSGFVMAGYTNSFGAGGYDMFVVRTDKIGNLIWQKTFGGLDWDFGYSVKATAAGDSLIIAGNTYSFGYGKTDGYIVKIGIDGNFGWQKTFGGAEDDEFRGLEVTSTGNYALVGKTKSYLDVKGDAWLLKLGSIGDSLTTKMYGSVNKIDFFNSIVERPNGNYALAGGSETFSAGKLDAYFAETDNLGNIIWFNFDGDANKDEEVFKIINSNSYYCDLVVVYTSETIAGTKKDMKKGLIKGGFYTGGTGTFGFAEDDEVFGLCNTRDKGFIAVGYTKSLSAFQQDIFLVKYDSLGTTLAAGDNVISVETITSTSESQIKVFPTFTNDFTNVVFSEEINNPLLTISDAIGNIIYKTNLKAKSQKIDISSFANGIYYFSFLDEKFSETIKIIKIE